MNYDGIYRKKKINDAIIVSLLDVDFYKFTMMQFILKFFPTALVRFAFKNRSKKITLARVIPIEALRAQLDHVRTLRFTDREISFLRTRCHLGGARLFKERFLSFLKNLVLPEYHLDYIGDDIVLTFSGNWPEVTLWETLSLSIINELYYREITIDLSEKEISDIYVEGRKRLRSKITILQANPQIAFNEFGTRRRHSFEWQGHVVSEFANFLPKKQFLGTSSTYFAMVFGLEPKGTNAHEIQMVIAGLMSDTDTNLLGSQLHMLQLWEQMYGPSIFLPDTFGTRSFLKLLPPKMGETWKGFRSDSGDPFDEGERYLAYYDQHGIDARDKLNLPSDGLELPLMISLERHFRDKIVTQFGWGTNATNDLGLDPLPMVTKAVAVNDIGLVKLSNNPEKAMGPTDEVTRYMRVFCYGEHVAQVCKY
jgi:nicotinate phosphoribosyltransferase